MAKISDEYKDRGLKILAFPCNQFGGQEPGTHEEILEFTRTIDPDMPDKLIFFEKAEVNGANAREVFGFLKEALPSDDGTGGIRWNFGTPSSLSQVRMILDEMPACILQFSKKKKIPHTLLTSFMQQNFWSITKENHSRGLHPRWPQRI